MKTAKRILIIAMTVLLFGSTLSCAKKVSVAEMSEKELEELAYVNNNALYKEYRNG